MSIQALHVHAVIEVSKIWEWCVSAGRRDVQDSDLTSPIRRPSLDTRFSFRRPLLIVLSHLLVRVRYERLDVFLWEFLLLVQPGTQCADLVKSEGLTGWQMVVGAPDVL